jgi:hypothetical protein
LDLHPDKFSKKNPAFFYVKTKKKFTSHVHQSQHDSHMESKTGLLKADVTTAIFDAYIV